MYIKRTSTRGSRMLEKKKEEKKKLQNYTKHEVKGEQLKTQEKFVSILLDPN